MQMFKSLQTYPHRPYKKSLETPAHGPLIKGHQVLVDLSFCSQVHLPIQKLFFFQSTLMGKAIFEPEIYYTQSTPHPHKHPNGGHKMANTNETTNTVRQWKDLDKLNEVSRRETNCMNALYLNGLNLDKDLNCFLTNF